MKKILGAIIAVVIFFLLLNLTVWGTGTYIIYRILNHFGII